jgi:hypothetical protein
MTDTSDSNAPDVAQRLRASERLSIKAVMVGTGEDPLPLLRKAGITEFLSVPVALAPDTGTAAALGDGRGASITAEWVPDQDDRADDAPANSDVQGVAADGSGNGSDTRQRPRPVNLPGAFGMRPIAPIERNS